MNNITVIDKYLIGCPTVSTSCNNILVSQNPMDCFPLASTQALVCNDPNVSPVNTTDPYASPTSKTILVVLVSVLGVLITLGMAYILFTKYVNLSQNIQQSTPATYIEDEEPLRDVDDE